MAIQSSIYIVDGSTRTFPSTKHIATKQHCAVYLKDATLLTWSAVQVSDYSLINNSIVFDTAPNATQFSEVEIRVVDNQSEIIDSPSDIAIVASAINNINIDAININDINTVATNIGAVNNTSASIANVNTVASNISSVNNVALNELNINTVVANATSINTVASDLLEPTSEINTVATSITNVDSVGASIANVNIVATNIANVNSIATTIVPNIVEILLADDNAATATAQAGIATTKASEAAASAASIDPLTLVRKDSSTGAASIPYGTTAQRPGTPSIGFMRFNTDLGKAEVWNGTLWAAVGAGATGGGADTVFVETSYAVTTNYTITAGKSAITVGDANGNVTIEDGVNIIIPDGSSWVIQGA